MFPDLTKEEIVLLRNHLAKEMKYFYQTPIEWDFWNSTYRLDEMGVILKKIDLCLQQEKE